MKRVRNRATHIVAIVFFFIAGAGTIIIPGASVASAEVGCERDFCKLEDYGSSNPYYVCAWATAAYNCTMQSNGDCWQESCE